MSASGKLEHPTETSGFPLSWGLARLSIITGAKQAMTDYLLVHGAGQGSWAWGKVWGLMTAPVEHPPTLHKPRRADRVHPVDLPGHGPDIAGDTAAVRLEECVEVITRAVEQEQLRDVVLVGHGVSGGIVLEASKHLPTPPKRLALVGAAVPEGQRPLIGGCASGVRSWFRLVSPAQHAVASAAQVLRAGH